MITGQENIYASGDILALNCTSGRSYPQSLLRWFINGIQVSIMLNYNYKDTNDCNQNNRIQYQHCRLLRAKNVFFYMLKTKKRFKIIVKLLELFFIFII